MKKLLVVLLALTVIGVVVFAQAAATPTVTFNGRVEAGFQINPDTKTVIMHDDDSGKASRVRLNVKAVLGDFELGYYMTDDYADTGNSFAASSYWAGYKFLDGKFIVRAGATDASTTKTVNKGWGNGINAVRGVQVVVVPMSGLSVGAAFGNITAAATDAKNTLYKPAVGLAYAIPSIGDLRVNYQSYDKLFTAGFNYSGMAGLVAQVEMYNIGYKAGTFTAGIGDIVKPSEFFEKGAYTMGSLTASVQAYEGIGKDLDLAFKVTPGVDYAVSPVITAGASFTYYSNAKKNAYAWKDIAKVTGKDGAYEDTGMSASPYVQFNFNKLASCLKIWYDTGFLANTKDSKIEVNFRSFF